MKYILVVDSAKFKSDEMVTLEKVVARSELIAYQSLTKVNEYGIQRPIHACFESPEYLMEQIAKTSYTS